MHTRIRQPGALSQAVLKVFRPFVLVWSGVPATQEFSNPCGQCTAYIHWRGPLHGDVHLHSFKRGPSWCPSKAEPHQGCCVRHQSKPDIGHVLALCMLMHKQGQNQGMCAAIASRGVVSSRYMAGSGDPRGNTVSTWELSPVIWDLQWFASAEACLCTAQCAGSQVMCRLPVKASGQKLFQAL